MGKKKAGRAAAKQKAKGRNSTTPRSTPRSRPGTFADDDWSDDGRVKFKGFAMNGNFTPQSASTTPFAKLRHQAISFVKPAATDTGASPERLHPDDDIALDDSDAESSDEDDLDDSNLQTNIVVEEEEIEISQKSMADMHIHATAEAMEVDAVEVAALDTTTGTLPFIVDTIGDASLADSASPAVPSLTKRAPSPALSNSSDEVVVFHGRSKANVVDDPVSGPTAAESLPVRQPPPSQGWGARASKHDTTQRPGDTWSPAPNIPYWKKGKGRAVPRPDLAPSAEELKKFDDSPPKQSKVKFTGADNDEFDVAPDAERTVAELQADWKNTLREKKKLLKDGDLTDGLKPSGSRHKKRGRKKSNRALARALVSDEDDDSEAAYEDYMENLKAQLDEAGSGGESDVLIKHLKATTRPSAIAGPSLVIHGEAVDDDEVLPSHMRLANDHEQDTFDQLNEDGSEWESDDSDLNPDLDELSQDESLNASELESDLEYTERQQWEDEDDLRQRRIDAMDDEAIARILAKQEELGMEADEVLLEDGNYPYISDDGYGDLARARAGLSDISNFSAGRRSNKHGIRRGAGKRDDFFPDASLMADTVEQYGESGFDIMDFDRPSLRPIKKGRKGKLPPELEAMSDEDLKGQMAAAWENDRSKKRQKKAEREELRADGLLGSAGRKGRADLSKRYPLGMNIHQVWSELADFLQDEDLMERAFPPMDKVDRKSLHEVATRLNMKSKSQGAGQKRFPIIYKTSRTEEYSPHLFKKVIDASTRGFYTNRHSAGRVARKAARAEKFGGKGKGKSKGGGGTDAATVRHGEIVGSGAAEIGQNSYGHKLMEKMGWSKGKGLGKDGEGLLVPVEQMMRRGTAGLG